MLRIGNIIVTTTSEFASVAVQLMPDAVNQAKPEIVQAAAKLVNLDLLSACMQADALFHRLKQRGVVEPADQVVCDDLVLAIGPALKFGPDPVQEANASEGGTCHPS